MDEAFTRDAIWQGDRGLKSGQCAFAAAPYLENRMGDKLRHKAKLPQGAEHRVEKERHVVVDDIDGKQLRLAGDALPEHDLRLARLTLTNALEGVAGESDEIARAVCLEFGGVDFVEKVLGETRRKIIPCLPGK
jgi:hypothetical protein